MIVSLLFTWVLRFDGLERDAADRGCLMGVKAAKGSSFGVSLLEDAIFLLLLRVDDVIFWEMFFFLQSFSKNHCSQFLSLFIM